MSLSDAFESTLPNNKSLKDLTGADVVKDLQKKQEIVFDDNEYDQTSFELNNNDAEDNDVNDDSIDSNLNTAVSFSERENKNIFTAEDDSFIEQRNKILDSQNFLPDTQSDEIIEQPKSFSLTQAILEDDQTQKNEKDADAEDDEDDEDRVVDNSRKSRSLKSVFSPIREQEEPFSSQKSPVKSKKINLGLSNVVKGSQKEDDEDENDKADDESSSSDEEVESDHEDEETKLLRLERIRAAKKLHELKIKKKQLEYKKKGMGQILEQEA
ncbi:unnamed protein product, partial [[Candida] boidinii]